MGLGVKGNDFLVVILVHQIYNYKYILPSRDNKYWRERYIKYVREGTFFEATNSHKHSNHTYVDTN